MPNPAAGGLALACREPGQAPELEERTFPPPGRGEVRIRVAGCGVCHTDIGFIYEGVPTRHALPLVPGHEISGVVEAAGEGVDEWLGREVIVPAVIPCGECAACRAGRETICRRQFMPGNDGDGGFATYVIVPARGLCPVPADRPETLSLATLSVVADAVTTPYEAVRRSGLREGDLAVFVGVGGVGGFGVQIAAALGAEVVALDVDDARLELAAAHGAVEALNVRRHDFRELRNAVRERTKARGDAHLGLKVFETSGTPEGQQTAFGLLDHGGYLGVVGYTPAKVGLRLSNLMALDATAQGNWGCPPRRYPEALKLVLEGKVRIDLYVETHDLREGPSVVEAVHRGGLKRRAVLVPPTA